MLPWEKISGVLNALAFEKAKDIIDAPKPLAAYGLDKPRLEASIAGGGDFKVAFGGKSQTPEGVYLKLSSRPEVLVVTTDLYDKFNIKVEDLVEPTPAKK